MCCSIPSSVSTSIVRGFLSFWRYFHLGLLVCFCLFLVRGCGFLECYDCIFPHLTLVFFIYFSSFLSFLFLLNFITGCSFLRSFIAASSLWTRHSSLSWLLFLYLSGYFGGPGHSPLLWLGVWLEDGQLGLFVCSFWYCTLCGVLWKISIGYSVVWMNGQFLPLLQFPLRKYLHTALCPDLGLVCSYRLSQLYVSLIMRIISCLALLTFCLFPASLDIRFFPFMIVWIWT